MTLQELNRIYKLKREIAMNEERLAELRQKAESPQSVRITGTPRSRKKGNPIEQYVAEIIDLEALIATKNEYYQKELENLNAYIEGTQDRLIQQILRLRFVESLTWVQVAQRVGGGNVGDNLRRMVYRYLKRTNCGGK